jgi:hypothetical protein
MTMKKWSDCFYIMISVLFCGSKQEARRKQKHNDTEVART